jgi:hypothetical protein
VYGRGDPCGRPVPQQSGARVPACWGNSDSGRLEKILNRLYNINNACLLKALQTTHHSPRQEFKSKKLLATPETFEPLQLLQHSSLSPTTRILMPHLKHLKHRKHLQPKLEPAP